MAGGNKPTGKGKTGEKGDDRDGARFTSVLTRKPVEGDILRHLGHGKIAPLASVTAAFNPILTSLVFLRDDEENPQRVTGIGMTESFYDGRHHARARMLPFTPQERVDAFNGVHAHLTERVAIDGVNLELVSRVVPDEGRLVLKGNLREAWMLLHEAITHVATTHEKLRPFINETERRGENELPDLMRRVGRVVERMATEQGDAPGALPPPKTPAKPKGGPRAPRPAGKTAG
jgi:hypothetical protein